MDYRRKAKEILSGCLFVPVEKIPDNGTLNNIKQLDSLTFESIVIELEKTIGHEVDAMDLLELRSVEDLTTLLEKELA